MVSTIFVIQLSSALLSFLFALPFHLAYDETGRHFSEGGIEIINKDAHCVARSGHSSFGGFLVLGSGVFRRDSKL